MLCTRTQRQKDVKVAESSEPGKQSSPPPPEFIEQEIETRNEQSLKYGDVDEPLELVSIEQSCPKATMRIETKMDPERR